MLKKLLLFCLVAVLLLILAMPSGMFLAIKDDSGKMLVSRPVGAGDVVRYGYIHSVEKVPVVDTFVVCGNGMLMMVNTTFSSSGVGLPTDSSYDLSLTDNGDFFVENINRTFDKVYFRVYTPSRCYFQVSGKDYPVYSMVDDGTAIVLTIEQKPILSALLNI
jgi:hypothetical protein